MVRILVTGAGGQSGQCLQSISQEYKEVEFVFMNSTALDITDEVRVNEVFSNEHPDYCLNLAAYTAVDKAEDEVELAYKVNAEAVLFLVKVCQKYDVTLVHISTDFVFDGEKNTPYTVSDIPNPINVYGASKLKGEEYIKTSLEKYYIVRTSWVYSDYGHNFKKTMLRLAETRDEISVVSDQVGCPTDAKELVKYLLLLIQDKQEYGLYHYRGNVVCSWYEFAVSIFKENNITIKVNPIGTEAYPSKARRPKYSVLG